jgi:Mn-dependent DtxR family transcriptional regulator
MTRPREQGITQAPEFPEWRIFLLLKHHSLGLTKFEIVHFIDVSPELAAAALKRLQTSGMVTLEKYARGELFYVIA